MNWALFGYNDKHPYGEFLAERNTKEELDVVKEQAIKDGYTRFSYSHADGSLPNFAKCVNRVV